MSDNATQPAPTISMQVVTYEDGTYGVSVFLTGLQSEQGAQHALSHMERMFCGQEIKES